MDRRIDLQSERVDVPVLEISSRYDNGRFDSLRAFGCASEHGKMFPESTPDSEAREMAEHRNNDKLSRQVWQ